MLSITSVQVILKKTGEIRVLDESLYGTLSETLIPDTEPALSVSQKAKMSQFLQSNK